MANRRMFSRGITSSGRFLRLSCQARALYYDLGMEADDDGFAEAFTRLSATGAQEKQLLELEEKGFITILDPEDLVIHINGWQENNLIRRDRYTPSRYLARFPQYQAVEINEPTPPQPEEPQNHREAPEGPQETNGEPVVAILGDNRLTQVRLGKDRLDQDRIEQDRKEKESINQENRNQDKLTQDRSTAPAWETEADFPEKANPGILEMEFCQKRQKAMDLLMKSKYFSNSRAEPV